MNPEAARFRDATGSGWYLTAEAPEITQRYLSHLGYLLPNERIMGTTLAGAGNMNLTLRVFTDRRHFILKQSRPWVAKFPDIDAPVERILVERDFLLTTSTHRLLARHGPELLRADAANFVLLIEDLGDARDLSDIYADEVKLSASELEAMVAYLANLHQLPADGFPANRALRRLNHAHIFDLPFRADNGFPLEAIHPGLAAVARPFQHDKKLREAARALGERYLAEGNRLIHGDFYPGSLMSDKGHLFVIDGEFAHPGQPEFDLGVLLAHLTLAGAEEHAKAARNGYQAAPDFDASLMERFRCVEIIRRLIGIAQLPLSLSLDDRQKLLDQARSGLV